MNNSLQRRLRSLVGRILFWLAVALVICFFLFPLYWMLVTSLKVRGEVTLSPPALLPFVQFKPTLNNYIEVLTRVKASQMGTATRLSEHRGLVPRHFGHDTALVSVPVQARLSDIAVFDPGLHYPIAYHAAL